MIFKLNHKLLWAGGGLIALLTVFMWLIFLNMDSLSLSWPEEPDKNPDNGAVAADDVAAAEVEKRSVVFTPVAPIDDRDYLLAGQGRQEEMIVYMDLSQEYSPDYFETVKSAATAYKDELRVALRPFFLRSSAMGLEAAVWAECAGQLGGAEAYYRAVEFILADMNSLMAIAEDLSDLAAAAEVGLTEMQMCAASDEAKANVRHRVSQAESAGVSGTPATFVGVRMLPGAYPLEDFTDSSDRQRDGLRTVIEEVLEPVRE